MAYSPRFSYTGSIVQAAEEVGAYRTVVSVLPLPLAVERRLRHDARVRVAHNSTWIENRTLTLEEAEHVIADKALADPTRSKAGAAEEVRNYFQALEYVDQCAGSVCDEEFIRRLHALIMRGSSPGRPREQSEYRRHTVTVGHFAYVPPAWEDVPRLISDLCAWAQGPGLGLPRWIFAAILAYQFVTIHPFHDGNGRTCRALATWAMRGPNEERAVDPVGLLNVEEFYVANLEGYYDALQMGLHWNYYHSNEKGSRSDPDLSQWIEYFSEMLAQSARQVRQTVVEQFRAVNSDVLADPIASYPRTFRRLLVRIPDPSIPFGPGEVAACLHVSDRTARTWLKNWHQQKLIQPAGTATKRVHVWSLAPDVAVHIGAERQQG
ncbi:MAG: Fic family protein [Polyangiaceae bacterium]|nr:Fic family protein [Polyangiaceae bacterium]